LQNAHQEWVLIGIFLMRNRGEVAVVNEEGGLHSGCHDTLESLLRGSISFDPCFFVGVDSLEVSSDTCEDRLGMIR
jgi:hypothetical protein